MTVIRLGLGLLLALAVYFVVAVEAVAGGRTLMPHAPAVLLIFGTWFLSTTPAVLVATAIGLGCDAIGTQLLGPGLIAAVSAALLASTLRQRWKLESLLAVALFGLGLALVLIAGPIVASRLLQTGASTSPLQIEAARATSSALAALAGILLVRIAGATRKLTTTAWNA